MFIRSIYPLLFITVGVSSMAQEGKESKKKGCQCSFTSINQIGLLFGEQDDAFQLQTVNGFRYRSWMAGVGVGIDGYRYRTIPLFFQLRKEFRLGPNSIFIYNDIGVNYPWLKTDQKIEWVESDYKHGFYYDGGIGYKVPIKKQWLLFSDVFSYVPRTKAMTHIRKNCSDSISHCNILISDYCLRCDTVHAFEPLSKQPHKRIFLLISK